MHEHAKSPNGRTAFEHRNKISSFRVLHRATEIHLVGLQNQSLGWDEYSSEAIRPPHVEHDFFVDKQFVVQSKVVAVGIELFVVKWLDPDITAQPSFNFRTAENHETPAAPVNPAGRK
jgi:hypothetical protein